MKISSKGRYAVRVMVDIASTDKDFVSLSEIAERQHITIKYLEQIISRLLKAGLLESMRGSQGGYRLAKKPNEYTIAEILSTTNDLPALAPCQTSDTPCPLKDKCTTVGCWDELTKLIYDYLNSVTLQDLINKNTKRS